jgi:hypothetical protein
MAIGLLGKQLLVADTATTVYTVPTDALYAIVSVNVLNTNSSIAEFKLAITSNSSASAVDYIENGTQIPADGGMLERADIMCSPGEKIIVNSSLSDVVVRVSGIEHTQMPK